MSSWLSFKRVARAGFVGFWRNGLVSVVSVFVMTVTLFTIGSILLANVYLESTLAEIQDKVDINVYFRIGTSESDILSLRSTVEALPQVKEVEYINKEEALSLFVDRNKNNSLIIQALEELGENPLRAVINIKAHDPSQYEGIAEFLSAYQESEFASSDTSIVDTTNFSKNQIVIERLSRIIEGSQRVGFFVAIILIVMTLLVALSTMQLAIYNSKDEIGVMRLVGANNSFIRGPFIIESVMYGLLAAVIALIILYPATAWVTSATASFFGGLDLVQYYRAHFGYLFLIILISGVILAVISSALAVRRYLKK